jgi:Flp pilus assembly protein TadB
VTDAYLAGGVAGLGLLLLVLAIFPSRPGVASRLAAYDAEARRHAEEAVRKDTGPSERRRSSAIKEDFGRAVARFYASRGWQQRSTRADLSLLDKSYETYMATKFLLPAAALVLIPFLVLFVEVIGARIPVAVPVWLCLLHGGLFFFLPDMELRQEATRRRNDFRHVVGAFLDLVSLNLAGGRGIPEALMSASQVGDGWAMRRIRDALANARITGRTPWQALGDLGEEIGVDELRDLSGALSLVADDGAKVRQSLSARAASMRSRQISDLEGKAGERSQSMLIAQLLFCLGFLVFLGFPAAMRVLSS